MSHSEHSFDAEYKAAGGGNALKFILFILVLGGFLWALVSSVEELAGVKEGIESASSNRNLKSNEIQKPELP